MPSLNDEIQRHGGPLGLLRAGGSGAYQFPIKSEFSNWRDEQESWRTTAALMDLSQHMVDLEVTGPDTYRLLSDIGANSFKNFGPMRAKQLVAVGPDGNLIGDAILFCLDENRVRIVGRPPALNWAEYNAATGGYNVEVRRDERRVDSSQPRELFRLQLQGPNATEIFEKVNGGPLPEIPFFTMGKFKVGSHEVTALNHRMSGFPGLELFGPYEEYDDVWATLLDAGAEYGITPIGGRAYASVAAESGWIANTLPAIYSHPDLQGFREWLPAKSFEGRLALGGSFVSDDIDDYYLTPWDVGYTHIAKFDHDFVGRDALERRVSEPHRKKSWIQWDRDDVARVFASQYEQGAARNKFIEMPAAYYTASQFDRIEREGRLVGYGMLPVYSSNVRAWITLGTLDEAEAVVGNDVELIWGEPDGGSNNRAVERHTQTPIRAKVIARPFSEDTQGSGNRTH